MRYSCKIHNAKYTMAVNISIMPSCLLLHIHEGSTTIILKNLLKMLWNQLHTLQTSDAPSFYLLWERICEILPSPVPEAGVKTLKEMPVKSLLFH